MNVINILITSIRVSRTIANDKHLLNYLEITRFIDIFIAIIDTLMMVITEASPTSPAQHPSRGIPQGDPLLDVRLGLSDLPQL